MELNTHKYSDEKDFFVTVKWEKNQVIFLKE
jgi:hypothetical protein